MPIVKLELSKAAYEQLLDIAQCAHRPPVWHAEWLLRKAIDEAAKQGERERDMVALVPEDTA